MSVVLAGTLASCRLARLIACLVCVEALSLLGSLSKRTLIRILTMMLCCKCSSVTNYCISIVI